MELGLLIKYYISLLVICNPFSSIPALLNFTHGRSADEKKRTGIISSFAVAVILIVVTWIGSPLMNFFGIRVAAFQLAGGIVVFLLALSMLNAEISRMKQTSEDQKEAKHKESVAVVPLAIPLMAGPGAISTVIVTVNNFPGIRDQVYLSLCAILVALSLGICLYFATALEKLLGQAGMNIVNRLAGLILAAIAMETIAKGVLGLFPGLG
jgi:multiple antibiotic resistance protein